MKARGTRRDRQRHPAPPGKKFDANYNLRQRRQRRADGVYPRARRQRASPDNIRVVGINPGPVGTDRHVTLLKTRARNQFGDEKPLYGISEGSSAPPSRACARNRRPDGRSWSSDRSGLHLGRDLHTPSMAASAPGGVSSPNRRHCEERSDEAIQSLLRGSGLLRGACHRARIRATRWLAMTWRPSPPSPPTLADQRRDPPRRRHQFIHDREMVGAGNLFIGHRQAKAGAMACEIRGLLAQQEAIPRCRQPATAASSRRQPAS